MKTSTGFQRPRTLVQGAAIACLIAVAASQNAIAALPVIDSSNLSQTMVSAAQNVAQTLKQIEQYKTQLQQYENMLQNTAAPAAYIWDQAATTMNRLRGAIDTLNYYKNTLGGIDSYLAKFKDTAAYRNSPCFSNAGCSSAEWGALQNSQTLGSESQKKATDALFKGLDQQHDAMEADARQLQRLQAAAQGAEGQMQAIGFANQLASEQSNQLLQIRALLMAQQNAIATRNQALANREAIETAAGEQFKKGSFQPSSPRSW